MILARHADTRLSGKPMTLDAAPTSSNDEPALDAGSAPALIPQPSRPSLPIRVPVVADCGGSSVRADVLGSTMNVLLLQGLDRGAAMPALGTPVRLRVEWDRQLLSGRIAAHGVAGRFLISLGERAIRRSRRFAIDVPGVATSAQLHGRVDVRVKDLSSGGARVEGIDLPIGSDVGLKFAPPGRSEPINVLGFVVRAIEGTSVPAVGVAFRLVQPSLDVLVQPPVS
jgi:hypothetical protein